MHRSYPVLLLAASTCLAIIVSVSAYASDEAGKACGADYQKFCAGVKPGEGRIGRCLMQHRQDLSNACQSYLTKVTQTLVHEFVAACQHDVVQYCRKVKPGEGRVLNCLKDQHDSLSSACQQLLHKL